MSCPHDVEGIREYEDDSLVTMGDSQADGDGTSDAPDPVEFCSTETEREEAA